MIEITGTLDSGTDLSNITLLGLVAGDATVSHGEAIINGMVTGNLVIEKLANVTIHGTINGNVTNHGNLILTGFIHGSVTNSSFSNFESSSGAVFN